MSSSFFFSRKLYVVVMLERFFFAFNFFLFWKNCARFLVSYQIRATPYSRFIIFFLCIGVFIFCHIGGLSYKVNRQYLICIYIL